jgi:hypothetical protein
MRETQASLAEVMALQARAQRVIATAVSGAARTRARRARPQQARLSTRVQEARTLVESGNIVKAAMVLPALKTDLTAFVEELEGVPTAQSSHKSR